MDARPTVLLFCRPYLVPDFRANFGPLADRYDLRFLTDGRSPGTDDTREAFYRHMKQGSVSPALTEADRIDVIKRCRLLRNIDRKQARSLLEATACALGEWLDRIAPRAVVCHMVDEYVTHLLSMLSRKRGIRYVGYAYSYFPGLIQATEYEYGRPFDFREPSVDEVREVIAKITKPFFRQDYGQRTNYTIRRHLFGTARYRVKQIVFAAKAVRERDPWNVHYALTPYIAERRHIRDFPSAADFARDWKTDVAQARRAGRTVVYMPLGYHPESTIDYWTPDTCIVDYDDQVVAMAKALAPHVTLVIKEHPHMMGARSRALYGRLRAVPGTVLVHPLEFSTEVLEASDAMMLGAGSGGVEAVLRDRPVFSFVATSYWFESSGATYLNLQRMDGWADVIRAGLRGYQPMSAAAKQGFIAGCLASTVRPRPGAMRWPHCDLGDLERLLATALGPGSHAAVAQPAA